MGTDVGAGDEWLIPRVLNDAYKVHISEEGEAAVALGPVQLLFLGTLAGTLSAFFGVGTDGKEPQYDDEGNIIVVEDEPDGTVEVVDTATASDVADAKQAAHADTAALAAEVAALREAVHALTTKLDQKG